MCRAGTNHPDRMYPGLWISSFSEQRRARTTVVLYFISNQTQICDVGTSVESWLQIARWQYPNY